MHILYVDESGDDGFPEDNIFSPDNAPSCKFVRSGLIIHDWKWKKINDIIADFKFSKRIPKDVELHATEIRRGKKKITDSKTKKRREHKIEKTHREFAKAIYTQSSHVKEFHFIESILFEPSESSELLQMVDIASYACFRKFNSNDSSLYDELKERIMKSSQGSIEGAGLKIWPSP